GDVHFHIQEELHEVIRRRACDLLSSAVVAQVLLAAPDHAQLQEVVPGDVVGLPEPLRLGFLPGAHLLAGVRAPGQGGPGPSQPQLRPLPILRPAAFHDLLRGDEQGHEQYPRELGAGPEGRLPRGASALHQRHGVHGGQALRLRGAPGRGEALRRRVARGRLLAAAGCGAPDGLRPGFDLRHVGSGDVSAGHGRGHAARHPGHVLSDADPVAAGEAAGGHPVGRGLQPAGLPRQRVQGPRPVQRRAGRSSVAVLRAVLPRAPGRRFRAVRAGQVGVRGPVM
ncbi:MAG: hypothetical protein AVDCRST_MAG22-59, partial [uncultured Rubrobacteraceae bacterium]